VSERSAQTETTQTESDMLAPGRDDATLMLLRVAPKLALDPIPLRPELVIGRDEGCDVQTRSSSSSRRHARITFQGHLWRCEDLDSRNGTLVNGQRIDRVPIGPGDVLRCGGWVALVVRRTVEARGLRFGELATGLFGGATLQLALAPLRKLAPSPLPVILQGETGTGKERVARALHDWSERTGPYLAVNCAALPESLAEAELFGVERGAFTGAAQDRPGFLRAARGGTLLLDEICELSPGAQAKLLRAIDQREVTPLGASRPVPIDVRIVAAAQRPLEAMVRDGRFREDLLARLGLTVALPTLRARLEDVPHLFEVFAREAFGRVPELEPRLVETLLLHPFPRNVRELRQLVEHLALLHHDAPRLGVQHLPATFLGAAFDRSSSDLPPRPTPPPGAPTLEPEPPDCGPPRAPSGSFRRREPDDWARLQEALAAQGGNVQGAARSIGLSRYQAYRLLGAHPEFDVDRLRPRS